MIIRPYAEPRLLAQGLDAASAQAVADLTELCEVSLILAPFSSLPSFMVESHGGDLGRSVRGCRQGGTRVTCGGRLALLIAPSCDAFGVFRTLAPFREDWCSLRQPSALNCCRLDPGDLCTAPQAHRELRAADGAAAATAGGGFAMVRARPGRF